MALYARHGLEYGFMNYIYDFIYGVLVQRDRPREASCLAIEAARVCPSLLDTPTALAIVRGEQE